MTTPHELIAQAAALLEQARELNVQLTRDDLKTMTPEQIVEAQDAGRLTDLLSQ